MKKLKWSVSREEWEMWVWCPKSKIGFVERIENRRPVGWLILLEQYTKHVDGGRMESVESKYSEVTSEGISDSFLKDKS